MITKLGNLITIKASSKKLDGDSFWLLNLYMVEQQSGAIIDYNFVSKDQLSGSIIQFDTDTVLYSKLRPNLNKVVLPSRDGYATSEMLPLKPDQTKLSKEYLTVFLRSDSYVAWAVSKTAGAKMPRLGTKELLGKDIPLPSLSEQKQIVAKFSKIERLILIRKKQLLKLDELVKSRFIELFGTKESPKCDVVKLSSLVKYQQGTQVDMDKQFAQCADGMTRFLRIIDYTQGNQEPRYVENKGTYIYADTVCIVRYGTVGFVCKGYEGILANNLFKLDLTTDKMDNDFLYCVLKYGTFENDIKALSNGATMPALSFKIMDTIDILLPSIEKQMEYTTSVEQTDKSKLAIQKSLEKLEILKKSLMQQYFG